MEVLILTIAVMIILHRMYMYYVVEPRHKKELDAAHKLIAQRVNQSRAVVWGQSCESLVPWLPEFKYSPPDVKHLGAPIDLVIFDGMTQGNLRKIVFVEIKTGSSQITSRERQIKQAVADGRIEFEMLRVKDKPHTEGA